jgi:hypothetical protein
MTVRKVTGIDIVEIKVHKTGEKIIFFVCEKRMPYTFSTNII